MIENNHHHPVLIGTNLHFLRIPTRREKRAQDGAPANPHPSQTALRMGHPPTVVGRYSRLHRSDRMRGKEPRAWKTNW